LDDGFEDAFQYTVAVNGSDRLKNTSLIERLNQVLRRKEKSFESYLSALQPID